MDNIGIDIGLAAQFLKKGDVIGFPTETVYGLAGNALNLNAVSKIFEVKNRPSFDPLIIHLSSLEKITDYALLDDERLLKLAHAFMPGPLTLLLEKKDNISDLVTAGLKRVAVRIPKHPTAQSLLKLLPFPLAAPSANPFGYVSPTTAQHVQDQLGQKIPYILEGGNATIGLESTIVGIEQGRVHVYRLGGVSVEQIEKTLQEPVAVRTSSSKPDAPGMLIAHYSPNKMNLLYKPNAPIEQDAGYLFFQTQNPEISVNSQFILSPSGDLGEAARNLFSHLRALDSLDINKIYIELVPNEGIGRAINDRLSRALVSH